LYDFINEYILKAKLKLYYNSMTVFGTYT